MRCLSKPVNLFFDKYIHRQRRHRSRTIHRVIHVSWDLPYPRSVTVHRDLVGLGIKHVELKNRRCVKSEYRTIAAKWKYWTIVEKQSDNITISQRHSRGITCHGRSALRSRQERKNRTMNQERSWKLLPKTENRSVPQPTHPLGRGPAQGETHILGGLVGLGKNNIIWQKDDGEENIFRI